MILSTTLKVNRIIHVSEYVDLELENVFNYLANSIIDTVADPVKIFKVTFNDIDYL